MFTHDLRTLPLSTIKTRADIIRSHSSKQIPAVKSGEKCLDPQQFLSLYHHFLGTGKQSYNYVKEREVLCLAAEYDDLKRMKSI